MSPVRPAVYSESAHSFVNIGSADPATVCSRESADSSISGSADPFVLGSAEPFILGSTEPVPAGFAKPIPSVLSASALSRNISTWISSLASDRDRQFILSGLCFGFRLVPADLPDIPPADCQNYASALDPAVKPRLDALFQSELDAGKLCLSATRPTRVHAIGAVPKKDSPDFRPITDCSRPRSDPLNAYIRPHLAKFRFASIDRVVGAMTPGCFMAVVDIKAAFRSVPVFPPHRQFLGFCWEFPGCAPCYLLDCVLSFGLSCSPIIFHRISTSVVRMMRRARALGLIHFSEIVVYLDDFCLVAPSEHDCSASLQFLVRLLCDLGFQLSASKLVSPSQRVRYLGIDLDSIQMKLFLPPDKVGLLHSMAAHLVAQEKCSKLELQQFCGLANFASKVVRGARTFCRRIIDLSNTLREQHHKTRVTREFRADLDWWVRFSSRFNGEAVIIADSRPRLLLQTDACFAGYGAVFGSLWLAGTWAGSAEPANAHLLPASPIWTPQVSVPNSVLDNINYLELFAVLLAARQWGHLWRNRRILLQSDNTQTVACINNGSSRNPLATELLRELFWLSAESNFHMTASHLPGHLNVTADRLSRLLDAQTLPSILISAPPG
ncbi:MAG: hypothetical protein GY835_03255 [bacterium]|nr:hypothetical protein [bacterium]